MKEVTKEEELRFLRKLEVYFKGIPQEVINQEISEIDHYDYCGCFGAHIARCFDDKTFISYTNEWCYDYAKGKRIFEDNLSIETQKLFFKNGLHRLEGFRFNIFSNKEWDEHPHTVIRRVIRELELELEE